MRVGNSGDSPALPQKLGSSGAPPCPERLESFVVDLYHLRLLVRAVGVLYSHGVWDTEGIPAKAGTGELDLQEIPPRANPMVAGELWGNIPTPVEGGTSGGMPA